MKLILENWKKFLEEDEEARERFAQGIEKLPKSIKDMKPTNRQAKPMVQAGKAIKRLYAKEADRAFLNSLKTIHWGYSRDILNIIQSYEKLKRDELSTVTYLPGEKVNSKGPWGMDFGILVKGYITLLANDMDDINSGSGENYKEQLPPERTASSGANKGVGRVRYHGDYKKFKIFVFDEEDYDPARDWAGGPRNEALVDNWKIEALIVAGDDEERIAHNKERFAFYLEKVGIDAKVVSANEL